MPMPIQNPSGMTKYKARCVFAEGSVLHEEVLIIRTYDTRYKNIYWGKDGVKQKIHDNYKNCVEVVEIKELV